MSLVGMCPGPSGSEWEQKGNPVLWEIKTSLASCGWDSVHLETGDLLRPDRLKSRGIQVLHFHWITAIFEFRDHDRPRWLRPRVLKSNSFWVRKVRRLVDMTVEWWNRLDRGRSLRLRLKKEIDAWFARLLQSEIPFVWQVHDLHDHQSSGQKALVEMQWYFCTQLCRHAFQVLLHEESCVSCVEEIYRHPLDRYTVARLGPMGHKNKVSRAAARQLLGIDEQTIVVACLGTARPNRNPARVCRAFERTNNGNQLLIVAGSGVTHYCGEVSGRVRVYDGFLEPEVLDQFFSAADFVVSDGELYLTSAVVRTSMEYGRSVIASAFGSNADMAKGALVEIHGGDVEEALCRAFQLSPADRESMGRAALLNNEERTWPRYAAAVSAVYSRALASGANP